MRLPLPDSYFTLHGNPSSIFKITDNLYIGDAPIIGPHIGVYFDDLFLCAKEYQPVDCFQNVSVHSMHLSNDGSIMTSNERIQVIRAASNILDMLNENRMVLVTCMAGRNRSGIVCALALMCGANGNRMESEEAISFVRNSRGPMALSNSQFVNFLHTFNSYRKTKNSDLSAVF